MRKIVIAQKIGYEDEFEQGKNWKYKTLQFQSDDQDDVEFLECLFDDTEDAINNLRGEEQ